MAFDAFLKVEGVESESTRKGHEGEIELISFSLGTSNSGSIGTGSGGGSGKSHLSAFNLIKRTDAGSPTLFQACCQGKHFKKAVATMHKSGGDSSVDYLKYEFEEVHIDSVQWSGSSGGDDVPTESVAFSFGKVTITYTKQNPDGSKGGSVVASWDVRTVSA